LTDVIKDEHITGVGVGFTDTDLVYMFIATDLNPRPVTYGQTDTPQKELAGNYLDQRD